MGLNYKMSKPERNVINFEDILARNEKSNVLFFNYDNEAFMNTGIQESGATPPFASTTTGPAGKKIPGKVGVKQDLITPFAFYGTKALFLALVLSLAVTASANLLPCL